MYTPDRIGVETLKLLVEVAWADHHVAAQELDHIVGLAAQVGASDEEIAELRGCLADEGRLPAPDFALLRQHRDAVLRAARDLVAVDRVIVDDEVRVVERIERLLEDQ